MKEVFMPSMDGLYQMQDKGANVYKYLLVKTIESIICDGLNYPSKGMFENVPEHLRENPEIARAVCSLYPDEMIYSEIARNDVDLAIKLMSCVGYKESGLDYLCRFDEGVLSNAVVLANAILKLQEELSNNPSYRFEYAGWELIYSKKGAGRLLDKIFNCEIDNCDLSMLFESVKDEVVRAIVNIEPFYAIRLSDDFFSNACYSRNEYIRREYLQSGIANYAERYGISSIVGTEFFGKDILYYTTIGMMCFTLNEIHQPLFQKMALFRVEQNLSDPVCEDVIRGILALDTDPILIEQEVFDAAIEHDPYFGEKLGLLRENAQLTKPCYQFSEQTIRQSSYPWTLEESSKVILKLKEMSTSPAHEVIHDQEYFRTFIKHYQQKQLEQRKTH